MEDMGQARLDLQALRSPRVFLLVLLSTTASFCTFQCSAALQIQTKLFFWDFWNRFGFFVAVLDFVLFSFLFFNEVPKNNHNSGHLVGIVICCRGK